MKEGVKEKSEIAKKEEEILKFWQENKIFEKSLGKPSPKGEFVFYEGPPTANGRPGIHHLLARAFKDLIPRYKTMRGFHVRRKGGWDTHGLPVELQVEKQLGLKSKKEIEKYGVAKFNKKCKESVWEYVDLWEKFTDRIGFWVDLKDPYITYKNEYIESVWNILKTVHEKGLLYKDYKVVPWCPRCGTALSSHELAQGYQDVKDLSVTVEFRLKDKPDTSILAWTTTPWTLPGNVALAIGENIDYVEIEKKDEGVGKMVRFILAKERLETIFGGNEFSIVKEMKGKDLIGLEYEPLYPYLKDNIQGHEKEKLKNAYKIYPASFVTTEDGTGVVHTAVMYGQDDFVLGTEVGLPKYHLVNEDGTFKEEVTPFAGRFVKDEEVAVDIIKDLAHRGLLFKKEKYEHSYPHCWRCKTPLIYFARDSWYIKMSELRDELVKENESINWVPAHIKEGRFGEWLREIKDWAISRERYWGTPLPIWRDENENVEVIGSIEELKEKSGGKLPVNENGELDLHKPFIDEIELNINGKKFKRVKEVMDVWFDSGGMPFAQDHYPIQTKDLNYPADFISEAIDQTRGWFYTLHAIGILMGKGMAYKNVICLGHILDAEGKKMSKSLGNIVDPWEMIDKYGVDVLRLWMYSVNQPGDSKNFDEKTVDELVKKVFNLLYNIISFYELNGGNITKPTGKSENILDRWIVSKLNKLVTEGESALDSYNVFEAARAIRDFVNDFSTWYIRRSRDRFKSDLEDRIEALATTRFVLLEFSKYLSSFAPFMAEHIYQKTREEKDPESVHLCEWPKAGEIDKEVLENMREVRRIVSLALEKRNAAGLKVRQPLQKLKIKNPKIKNSSEYISLVKDEVNVKEVRFDEKLGEEVELDTILTPELIREGSIRDIVRAVQDLRKEKKLTPDQKIILKAEADDSGKQFVKSVENDIKKPTNISEIIFVDNGGLELKIPARSAGGENFKLKIDLDVP